MMRINWKIFTLLLVSGFLSVVAVFPYVLTVQSELLAQLPITMPILFVIQLTQTAVLLAITIWLGLFFTKQIGFTLPIFQTIVEHKDYKAVIKKVIPNAVILGVTVAIIIYTVDSLFAIMGTTISTHETVAPAWQTFLAALYGGITEEILMRLFLTTLFIWLGTKLFKQSHPTNLNIVISIVLASIIFGLGHLPLTASITTINALVVTRAIVLNGIGGVVFGWLFWKKGLESAIVAHFTTDVVLLTLLPLMFN